jgi:hypothetical protein
METDPVDAQSALDTAAAAERRSAKIATPPLWFDLWFGVTCAVIPVVVLLVGAAAASTQLAWSYGLGWWLVPVAVATAVLATLLSRTGNAMYAHVLGAR